MIAQWSVNNRVAVNILAIALLVLGLVIAGTRLQRDIFPDVSTNFIRITTVDATTAIAEDIEQLITIPIEEETANAEGVLNVLSISQDNISNIFLEIDPGIENMDPILNQVRQEVSRARPKLPSTAEEPIIEQFDIPFPLLTLGVTLPADFRPGDHQQELDRMERELKRVSGVSEVLIDGLGDREIWVEVDPFLTEPSGVSLQEITRVLSRKNQDWVGGRMETIGGENVIRLQGRVSASEALESLPVRETGSGVIRLHDLARLKETTSKEQARGRINLSPSISYTIVKKRGADAIETAGEVRRVFSEAEQFLPEGIGTLVVADSTKYIDTRIQTVLQNGIQALVIVTVLLVMLLNWRLAVLIAIGLPLSFAGTFIVLYYMGESINLLSLFAMIMALGMIVDDALVIAENVYRHYEEGYLPHEAAIKGTTQVIWPVLGSVATTIAAFLPLILGEGLIGKFLFIVPVVVVTALCFSLVQAFIILPSHLCDFIRHPVPISVMEKERRTARPLRRLYLSAAIVYGEVRLAVDRLLSNVIDTYLYLLKVSLRRRYIVILGFVLTLTGGGGLAAAGIIRFELFHSDYADQIFVKMDFPSDYGLDQTEAVVRRIEQTIAEELPSDDIFGLSTQIGRKLDDTNQFRRSGANLAMITVDIDERNPASRPAAPIMRDLLAILDRFPELSQGTAEAPTGGPPVGRAVNVQIMGEDFSVLREIAAELEQRLKGVDGILNLSNDFELGKTEYIVEVDEEEAARAGLDSTDIGQTLQAAYRGLEAARLRWGNAEVIIRVKMDERLQRDPETLYSLPLINADGESVRLHSVAELRKSSGIARILRRNQLRVVTVSSDVDTRILTSNEANRVIENWKAEFEELYPGYRLDLTGENEDTQRSIEAMKVSAVMAILLIYIILAVIFNSFLQPLIVMAVIPFGAIGVLAGLLFMGEPMGLMSIMGTIALAGIVVNNSVVFVHFINKHRDRASSISAGRSGYCRWNSILQSGKVRFRPIFLTTATTVGGLFTLAFTTRGQEQFLAPMAQAVIFGLLFASLITMLLIPCLYAIIDDIRFLCQRKEPKNTPEFTTRSVQKTAPEDLELISSN